VVDEGCDRGRWISTGHWHTCAVVNINQAKCWGDGLKGELGDGSTADSNVPVPIDQGTLSVLRISAGYMFSCGIFSLGGFSGGVKCWGDNSDGKLGDPNYTSPISTTPIGVLGLSLTSSGVVQVALGLNHACALLSNGAMKCWGDNSLGQLGDGTTTDRKAPTDVSGLNSGVISITAGWNHTCATVSSGTTVGMKCWGLNVYGQLGDGSKLTRNTPTDVTGLSSGVSSGTFAISAGRNHTCAVTEQGLKCWGENKNGQLGDGTTTDSNIPVPVSGLSSGVTMVSAGFAHTCALMNSGGIKCWGANWHGQLGNSSYFQKTTPVDVSGINNATMISAGGGHSCALTSTQSVKCWGANYNGELGDGTNDDKNVPVKVYKFVP